LAYSTDTEVREMMEEIRSKQEERMDAILTYPPYEKPPVSPKLRSKSKGTKVPRGPTTIHIENEQVTSLLDISEINVENTSKEFGTFVTTRVDLALSPLDDRIETFLVDVAQLQAPLSLQCHPIYPIEVNESTKMNKTSSFPVLGPARQSNGLFAGLLESLFHDEAIPIIDIPTAACSASESSAATELTEESTLDGAANEPTSERKGLPNYTYTQFMETLLRDESIPNPLGEGIPLEIEISRVD
jgi:hypothetical protein